MRHNEIGEVPVDGESRAALEWTGAKRGAYDRVSRLKGEQRVR